MHNKSNEKERGKKQTYIPTFRKNILTLTT